MGLMAYRDPKGERDKRMPEKRRSSPGVRGGASRDPRDMAKVGMGRGPPPSDEMLVARSRRNPGNLTRLDDPVATDRLGDRSLTGGTYPAMAGVDRVQERRRAAALARHYRDHEDLTITAAPGSFAGDDQGVLLMRREAPCCIPGAAGRDSEEGPWV